MESGRIDEFHKGGGIWFGVSKSDRNFPDQLEMKKDKVNHTILMWKIHYYDSFWRDYVEDAESKGYRGGREVLMR